MAKILLVEDDLALAVQEADALKTQGYLVDHAVSVSEATLLLKRVIYDLAILDRNLADGDGNSVCMQIRHSGKGDIPIIFVTADSAVTAKLRSFDLGADDYLTKPFDMRELIARVRAQLKRPTQLRPNKITIRDVVIDKDAHQVFQNQQLISLFPMEYSLLEFLASHPGQIFSAEALLKQVWPTQADSSPETVRTTIMRIRQKIRCPEDRPLIVTLRNIGYRLEP